ncbi:MAG: MFS transporter [Planctomycetales bacterium]
MNARWLFVCSCIALVTSAFTFSLHGDVMQSMGSHFNFTQKENGDIGQAIFYGMAISMFVGGFICDALGIKKIMILAFLSHILGSLGMALAPKFVEMTGASPWQWLYISGLVMGCGNGFTEVGVNPLVASIYPKEKTHYLNILHAWWPGGLILGGCLAIVLKNFVFKSATSPIPGLAPWQFELLMIVIPAIVYGLMLIPAKFPPTERVESGVSNAEMFSQVLRPMFLLWAFCMLLTAATELGPQKWQESVMTSTAKVSGTMILVYTSGMMFVLRHFAGPIAHRLSPIGMLTCSAILSAVGLYLLSFATDAVTAFTYATIFGLGIAYFWPTMLGVAAERFPKGGALILALMGTAGNISIAFILPQMGHIADHYNVEYVEKTAPDLADMLLKKNTAGKYDGLDEKKIADLEKANAEETGKAADVKDVKALEIAKKAKSVGFSMAFRWVSCLPTILIVIFGAIFLYDKARGGYKPEVISPGGGH